MTDAIPEQETEKKDLLSAKIQSLRKVIDGYEKGMVGEFDLFAAAFDGWRELNADPAMRERIDKSIRTKRMGLHQLASIDMSKGDPVRKRYDPEEWVKNVPEGYEGSPVNFYLDRSKSLLTFLENLE